MASNFRRHKREKVKESLVTLVYMYFEMIKAKENQSKAIYKSDQMPCFTHNYSFDLDLDNALVAIISALAKKYIQDR